MVSVSDIIKDHFDFSDFFSSTPVPGQVTGTQSQYDILRDALTTIYSDSIFSKIFVPHDLSPDTMKRTDVLKVVMASDTNNAFFASPTQALDNDPNHVPGNSYIGFGAGILGGLKTKTISGSDGHDPIPLIVLHEIVHSIVSPVPYSGSYREETTVFLTNYFKNRIYGDFDNRVGHTYNADTFSSASSTSYINGYELQPFIGATASDINQVFEFKNVSGDYLKKTYFGEGFKGADHVIMITGTSAAGSVLDSAGKLKDQFKEIVNNSLVTDEDQKIAFLKPTETAINQFMATMLDVIGGRGQITSLSKTRKMLPSFSAESITTLSAERFTDYRQDGSHQDVVGPVKAGAHTNSISDSEIDLPIMLESFTGSMIFGSSGIAASRMPNGSPINLDGATDKIFGGGGNDVIFLGDGIDPQGVRVNQAEGSSGVNILVGALSSAAKGLLIGSNAGSSYSGSNIFISGAGHDMIVGGYEGLVSYAASAAGVTIDKSITSSVTFKGLDGLTYTKTASFGAGGDAAGDTYVEVREFIGSQTAANTFHTSAANDTSYFIGGAGDDVFHLKAGDSAFGGAGNDTFYIDTSRGGFLWILDIEKGDKIYVDGKLYTGRTIEIEKVPHVENGHTWYSYAVTKDESAWGPRHINDQIHGQPRNDWLYYGRNSDGTENGVAFLRFEDNDAHQSSTVVLGGYQAGDGGVEMKLDYPVYGPDGVASIITGDGHDYYYARYSNIGWDTFTSFWS